MRREILVTLAIIAILILSSCNITGNAIKEGTPEFDAALSARVDECGQFGRTMAASDCFQKAAFEFNRPGLCNLAGSNHDHCITFVAGKSKNPDLCKLAGKMENICLHSVGVETPKVD